ncbi:MAG: metallophosphoesterase [Clostridia bacterium]|nr:metallophosphoesterase [Clostridia bacterium]
MKKFKKLLAVALAVLMVLSVAPMSTFAEMGKERIVASLPFVSISDTHYYPESLMGKDENGNDNAAWLEHMALSAKMFPESDAIIRTALDTISERAKENGAKYVLVPGDLTKDSEYEAHVGLAKIFEEYEEKFGLEFIVINGNHDINTTKADTFVNGKKEMARAITPAEFPEVYKNLGYDLAIDRFAYPENGEEVLNALSYVVDLDENFRLIVVDSNNYSFGEPQKDITNGTVSEEFMQWVKKWADDATANGKEPFVMIHHSLAAHMETEPSISFAFVLDDYMDVAEAFASWGINYAFTGHLHTNDIAVTVNDDGEAIYDLETASVTSYPNTYRENTISLKANGESVMSTFTVDFDDRAQFTYDGVTYDKNSYKYHAFDRAYGGVMTEDGKASTDAFLMAIVKSYLGPILKDIKAQGGILPYLKTLNIDLEKIISDFLAPYIGDGIKIGSYKVFSTDNIMWFVEDLLQQVADLYVENPEALYEILSKAITELTAFEISEVPCTKFIESLGFGDPSKPGTLGDAVLSVLAYWTTGDEDISDDAFMQDALDKFENGNTVKDFFYLLVDILLEDIVEDGILAKLEIRVDKLLGDDQLQSKMGEGINYLISYVLRDDFTYMNLVNIIFALEILPYTSIYDALDQLLMKKYLTDSQFESLGIFIAYVLRDFTTDENPIFLGDSDVSYTSETVEVEATQKNYRLPTMVSVTMGEDSETEAFVNWFSKSTLEATDIEIYKADSEPDFKGVATTEADFEIETESKIVERQFPGIDIGIAGILWYKFDMAQHTVTLSDLEPGATYYYRVGNAEYGWWSETGKITTADGGDDVTFFHMTDPQSQNVRQYDRAWAKVLETAFETYPDADFILNTGDLVDHGDNNKLWQYMFDCGSEQIMNTFMMPVTGNHEGYGTNATANYFVLPGMPEQDTATGVYYSFDYNNVHIAVLNTEALNEDESLSDEQIQWLKKDMAASDAQWKFVALHKAIYSQGSHYKDDDVCAMRTQLSALMPELDIDMVFQGHDHVYMRTGSIVANEKIATEITYLEKGADVYKTQVLPEGTSYVISGCAGVKNYIQNDVSVTDEYFPRAEKALSFEAPMFSAIKIEDGVLYFDAYVVDDEGAVVVDRFAIQKDVTQGDVAEDYEAAEEEVETQEATSFLITLLEYIFKIFKIVFNIYKIYVVGIELK